MPFSHGKDGGVCVFCAISDSPRERRRGGTLDRPPSGFAEFCLRRCRGGTLTRPSPRCGMFSHPSRRGGACPSRRFLEGFHFTRRVSPCGGEPAGQETRPYGVSGKSQQNETTGGASPSPTTFQENNEKIERRTARKRPSAVCSSYCPPQQASCRRGRAKI